MKKNTKGIISLVLSAAIYGSFGILIQWMSTDMPVVSQIIFRYSLAVIVVLVLLAIVRPRLEAPRAAWPMLALFVLVTQASIWSFTQGAVLTTIPSLLGSFYIGSIVTATILGRLVFGDHITHKHWIGTLIAIGGLYVLTHENMGGVGVIYGLLAGALECITQGMRKHLKVVSRGVILLVSLVGVLAVSGVMAGISGAPISTPSLMSSWVAGGIFAMLVVVVNISVTYGFRAVAMNVGSIIMSSEILFGMVLSTLLLSISPTRSEIVAATAIMISMLVQNSNIKKNNKFVAMTRRILED